MKIVHLCLGNYYADGFGYQENIITKYHKEEGFDVTVIASRVNYNKKTVEQFLDEAKEYFNIDGIKIKRINYKYTSSRILFKISKTLRLYNNLFEELTKESPDIIFIHGAQFWDIKQIGKYKELNKDVTIYADNHADYINSAKKFLSKNVLHKIIWRYKIKNFLPYCKKFWGVTPNRCNFLREVYKVPADKIDLLPMGADSNKIDFAHKYEIRELIRKKFFLQPDDFIVISGGRIDKRKNIHHLITAINQIQNPNIKLLLIGTATEEMKEIIEKISESDYVKKVGWVNSEDIYDYFLASDLAVFPGTHSVLWEQAVGTGVPCIFRRWEGMDHVDVGGNCKFIDKGDVEEIIKNIKEVYNNKQDYNIMKNIAETKGAKIFSYREIAKKSIGQE